MHYTRAETAGTLHQYYEMLTIWQVMDNGATNVAFDDVNRTSRRQSMTKQSTVEEHRSTAGDGKKFHNSRIRVDFR